MIKNRLGLVVPVSILLALVFGVSANAQYLISTKAGFINRVDGQVYILRGDQDDDKERATLGSQMENGDRLSTDSKGFAEALLNPGSYLRLDSNTEVRAVNIDLDTVQFELIKGSVIVEVGQIEKNTPIEIITPNGPLSIAKSGLQRIDVKDNSTIVAVRQGEIVLGPPSELESGGSAKIKSGKVVTLTGQGGEKPDHSDIAELNKDAGVDNFDTWSFDRAQALTSANVQAVNGLGSGSLAMNGWYYDPLYNFYTYVPGRSSFFSPYGFGFFNNYQSTFGYMPYYGYGFGPRAYTTYRGYYNNTARTNTARTQPTTTPRMISGTHPSTVTSTTVRPGSNIGAGFNHGGGTTTAGASSGSRTSSSSPVSHSTGVSHSPGGGVSHVGGGAARGK